VFFGRIRLRKFLGYECVCWTTYWQRPISATCHRVLQDVLRRYRFEHSEVAPTPTKRVSNSSPLLLRLCDGCDLGLDSTNVVGRREQDLQSSYACRH